MHRRVSRHVKFQPRPQGNPRGAPTTSFIMASSSGYNNSDVVIVAAGRTPIGNLNGCLSSLKGHELGAMVIRDVLARGNVPASDVAEVIMGQVCTAGYMLIFSFLYVFPISVYLLCLDKSLSILQNFEIFRG